MTWGRGPVRATSDLHLTESTASYVFAALQQLREDAEATGGATVIVGDVFDDAVQMHMPTWNRLADYLATWPSELWVVVGNHDQYGPRYYDNCLQHLRGGAGGALHVVSRPTWSWLGRMIPYLREEQDFVAALEPGPGDIPPTGAPWLRDMVWAHQGFRGAYRNAMSVDRDGFAVSAFPKGKVICSGHYHMPQVVGPVVYCGSPYQTSFAEEGQRKGWLRWDDPFASLVPRRIEFDLNAPKHYTVHWDPAAGPPARPPEARDTDKIRVVTMAGRSVALDRKAQLDKAGLAGVPVLAKPDYGTRVAVQADEGLEAAALRWVLANSDLPHEDIADLARDLPWNG